MKNLLAQFASDTPQSLALVVGDRQWTYAELAADVSRWAQVFYDLGIRPGDQVGICGANCREWVLCAHATWWLGATVVGLHHQATSGELTAQSDAVDLALIVHDERAALLASEPSKSIKTATFAELTDSAAADTGAARKPESMGVQALLTIQFTSGSTGVAKAVPLTLGNHRASVAAVVAHLGRRDNDRWLCCLPLCHIGGLAILLRSVACGTAVELMPRFDAEKAIEYIRQRPLTLASFVPTMLNQILARCDDSLASTLRCVLIGGGPIHGDDLRRARRLGLPVASTYGMTEACSQLTTLAADADEEWLDTAGRALTGVELQILGDDGQVLCPGEVGRIFVRGPMITAGYLNAKTPRDRQGWFDTGDYGAIDGKGYLCVAHRRGQRIVSGGENVSPAEVEACLRQAPAVADVAVVGVDDARWGQVVAAMIVAADDTDMAPDLDGLRAFCRRQLAPYKVPRRWVLGDQIPRGSTGKVDRQKIRQVIRSKSQ